MGPALGMRGRQAATRDEIRQRADAARVPLNEQRLVDLARVRQSKPPEVAVANIVEHSRPRESGPRPIPRKLSSGPVFGINKHSIGIAGGEEAESCEYPVRAAVVVEDRHGPRDRHYLLEGRRGGRYIDVDDVAVSDAVDRMRGARRDAPEAGAISRLRFAGGPARVKAGRQPRCERLVYRVRPADPIRTPRMVVACECPLLVQHTWNYHRPTDVFTLPTLIK